MIRKFGLWALDALLPFLARSWQSSASLEARVPPFSQKRKDFFRIMKFHMCVFPLPSPRIFCSPSLPLFFLKTLQMPASFLHRKEYERRPLKIEMNAPAQTTQSNVEKNEIFLFPFSPLRDKRKSPNVSFPHCQADIEAFICQFAGFLFFFSHREGRIRERSASPLSRVKDLFPADNGQSAHRSPLLSPKKRALPLSFSLW